MITHLRGLVHSLDSDHTVLDVGGVGYRVVCSGPTLQRLAPGDTTLLLTELVIREDAHLLFGFHSPEERDMYRLLVSVQGVGARVAMALLSLGSLGDLVVALQEDNKAYLSQADGVGPKLVARLLTELKDRIAKLAILKTESLKTSSYVKKSPAFIEARGALIALGYRPLEVEQALANRNPDGGTVEDMIRLGLQHLGRQS